LEVSTSPPGTGESRAVARFDSVPIPPNYTIIENMRRKKGALTELEYSILNGAVRLCGQGGEFYGFQIASEIEDKEGARRLIGLGTLYRALDRLERQGYLTRRWEEPEVAAQENRPRRRFYKVTGKALSVALTSTPNNVPLVLAFEESII
jgi:PadR family transcriptional regulator, regulatory protein PadR